MCQFQNPSFQLVVFNISRVPPTRPMSNKVRAQDLRGDLGTNTCTCSGRVEWAWGLVKTTGRRARDWASTATQFRKTGVTRALPSSRHHGMHERDLLTIWPPKRAHQITLSYAENHLVKAALRPIRSAKTIATGGSTWLSKTFTCARYKKRSCTRERVRPKTD